MVSFKTIAGALAVAKGTKGMWEALLPFFEELLSFSPDELWNKEKIWSLKTIPAPSTNDKISTGMVVLRLFTFPFSSKRKSMTKRESSVRLQVSRGRP